MPNAAWFEWIDADGKKRAELRLYCGCGLSHIIPIGDCDPKQLTCAHNFRDVDDSLRCQCGLVLTGELLAATGFRHCNGIRTPAMQKLADECQILRDENTKLLAENARLRRALERNRG